MLLLVSLILVFLYFAIFSALEKPSSLITAQRDRNAALNLVNSTFTIDQMTKVSSLPNKCVTPLSIQNANTDCISLCNHADATVQTFKTSYYSNNKEYPPGLYCMLSNPTQCNSSTTYIINDDVGWRCIPKYFEFQGSSGRDINVCGGKIHDALTDREYTGQIPVNLIMSSPEELFNGTYRFNCLNEEDPDSLNQYVSIPGSHLIRVQNPCTQGIRHPIKIAYNFSTFECQCVLPLIKTGPACSSCKEGLGNRAYPGLRYSYATTSLCQDHELPYIGDLGPACIDANCFYFSVAKSYDNTQGPLCREILTENLEYYQNPEFHHDRYILESRLLHEAIWHQHAHRNKNFKLRASPRYFNVNQRKHLNSILKRYKRKKRATSHSSTDHTIVPHNLLEHTMEPEHHNTEIPRAFINRHEYITPYSIWKQDVGVNENGILEYLSDQRPVKEHEGLGKKVI